MSKFTQSFDEWIDNPEFGFYINDNWNIEENTDGGVGLLKLLSPWDVILKYVLVQDEQGRFPYSTVLLSAIKKSGKTVMAACVTAWYAECAPGGSEIFICANSEEQSVRLIFKDLKFHFEQRGGSRILKDKIILKNGTLIQVLTKNYTSNAGGRHALVIFDELWGATSTADYRRFDEMTPIPTIPHSLQLITSYAGFYGESNLLHDVYLRSVDDDEANGEGGQGTLIPELAPYPCYENGDAYFAYWDHEPRMPWQTQKYYDKQLQTLRPSAYIRLHENRWVTSNETFIPMEWWKTAVDNFTQVCHNIQEVADRPISDPQQADLWRSHPYVDNPLYLAIDTGMKHDCTAIIGVTTDAELGKVIMMVHKIWTPVEGEILDLESTIEPYIKELSGLFNIVDITCDPSQMLQLMTKFRGMGLPVSEFTQSEGGMISASQNLYDLLHDKNLWAYESAELETHLKNSIAQHTSRGFRIVKDKSNRRIARKKVDAAIALAMAAYKAVLDIDFTGGEVIRIEDPFSSRQAVPRPKDFKEEDIPWELRD